MAKKTVTPAPRIDPIRLTNLHEPTIVPEAHGAYDGERYAHRDLTDHDLSGATFTECAFADLIAHGIQLRDARFADTVIDRLNAPVLRGVRSDFHDVTIDASRLGSAELYDSSWRSVHISNSKLGYLNLRNAILNDVLFTNCSIDELDLGGAQLTRVAFENTSISTLDIRNATLTHVDLRDVSLTTIEGLDNLRGATMSSDQIAALARVFADRAGIIIQD